MDAYLSNRNDLPYSDEHPILLAATSDAAMARAQRTIDAAGLRVAAKLSIETASARIDQQVAASALWVELDKDCGGRMDELLARVSRDVAAGRYAAVVSTTAELVDPLAARIEDAAVELIVDADEGERAAALAIATAVHRSPLRVADVASDKNAERLRQLSDEVSRIAATLARLSAGPGAPSRPPEAVPAGDVPPLAVETVRNVIRARRLRARYFAEELFADPAWDMLLDLLQAEIAQLRVPVSSLCIAAAVPATTALRWLKTMVSQGIFIRRADPHDGRRVFVELAPEASQALRRYFADVGPVAVI
jgi:DNA-binding MarR family transcriptional regulator